MGRSVGLGVVFALVAGLLVAPAPGTAAGTTGPQERSAVPVQLAAAKKSSKGRVIVGMTGSGSYTLRGKKLRKSASASKMFKVKAGTYTLKAPGGRVKPGKFRVRPGKTVRVKVTFPNTGAPAADAPVTAPPPVTPNPTTPPSGPVQQWVDAGAAATVTTAGGYGITIPAGVVQQRSLVSVTPLPAQDGVLPTADFHIDGPWSGVVSVSLPTPADMAGKEPMVLHDTAAGLRVTSGQHINGGSASGVPTVTVEATSLSQFTATGVPCPAADQPLLLALVVGCSDHNGEPLEDVWKATAEKKWQQALALEQADEACGPASGNVAEVGAIIKAKMSCSLAASGSDGQFRFTNTSSESFFGWELPVAIRRSDSGAPIDAVTDTSDVAWAIRSLPDHTGSGRLLYPGASVTLTKANSPQESDITWQVDRDATIEAVLIQFAFAQLGENGHSIAALKSELGDKMAACLKKATLRDTIACSFEIAGEAAKVLLDTVVGATVKNLLLGIDIVGALGAVADGLDAQCVNTHLINSTPTDPPNIRGGTSWIARNPDNSRAVLVDGATVRPITNGGTFNCLATTRVVWDIPTLRALRTATPQPAVCDNSGRTAWDVRPAPDGNVGTGIILRDTSTTPHANYLINSAGKLQTIPNGDTYLCLAAADPVIWNVPKDKINAWTPVGAGPAGCGSPPPGGTPGAIRRVSTDSSGEQGNSDSGSGGHAWAPDGTKIAFASRASNFVPNDTNASDVFVKSLTTGVIDRISTDKDGQQAETPSMGSGSAYPAWSPDGNRVAFSSDANNLVPNDTNAEQDVFVKTLSTGAIERVSTDSDASQLGWPSYQPLWSPDGTKIAFSTCTSSCTGQIFVKDLTSGRLVDVSTSADGVPADRFARGPVWSPDGTRMAFSSAATNLIPGDTSPPGRHLYIKSLTTGALDRLNTATDGVVDAWSPDGTKIAFSSVDELVPGDTNRFPDAFVQDLETGSVTRVSTDSSGGQAANCPSFGSGGAAWSPDGTKIAFWSDCGTLVPGVHPGCFYCLRPYVKDLKTGATEVVDTTSSGTPGNAGSSWGRTTIHWSSDGSQVSFVSSADDLVPGDTNQWDDLFVKTLP